MSITDIAAGRMAAQPRQDFGVRRIPPGRAEPHPARVPSAVAQAVLGYLKDFRARLPGLWQQIRARTLAWLFRFWGLGVRSLAQVPWLLRQQLKFLRLAMRRDEAKAQQAAIRALLRSEASSTLVRVCAYLGALAVLGATAAHFVPPAQSTLATDPAPAVSEWVQVVKPFPAFSLPLSELGENGPDYALRRHAVGGGRQDILTWGELKSSAPHLRIEIYRPASERTRFDSPEREIAARLADRDAETVTLRPAGEIETKFGTVALVEFSLSEPKRQCLGFARAYHDPQLQILGWHCASGATMVERELAACAIDRLSLLAGGSEPKLRELFARAELRRNFCWQRTHLMTPTPKLGPSAPPPELRYRRLTAG